MRGVLLFIALAAAAPAPAQQQAPSGLQARVEATLRAIGPGPRFGLVVATEDGRELVAIAPEGRFIPASNTKMFTTAAAYAKLTGLEAPDAAGGAAVRLERGSGRDADVILEGNGDARLSSAPDCIANCLAALADAVAAKTRRIHDVVGDDSLFADERWSPGMSWNNIPSRYGTAASALSVDDNELVVRVMPGVGGQAPRLEHLPYYRIENAALTSPGGAESLAVHRLPGSAVVRLTGTVPAGTEAVTLRLGIDDPAHYAAWRLKALLEERGVRVTGAVRAHHRPPGDATSAPPARAPLLRLTPPPLAENLLRINKESQNLHAELLLRRIGVSRSDASIAGGIAAVREVAQGAGMAPAHLDLSDGSGMSTYNRLSPRGVVLFLRWAAAQPWGAAWRATLPVAGVDGTLARRFRGTPLEGRLFAKTGSLNATNALSGYMIAKSGRTLLFSVFANDVPEGAAATQAMDAALATIAEAN